MLAPTSTFCLLTLLDGYLQRRWTLKNTLQNINGLLFVSYFAREAEAQIGKASLFQLFSSEVSDYSRVLRLTDMSFGNV